MAVDLSLTTHTPQACILELKGVLDQVSITNDYWPMITKNDRASLLESGQLTVDLSNVERADTAGLAWLINIVKHARADNVQVNFTNVPTKLLNLADLSSARDIIAP